MYRLGELKVQTSPPSSDLTQVEVEQNVVYGRVKGKYINERYTEIHVLHIMKPL